MTSLPHGDRRLRGDHAAILPDIFRLLQLEMSNGGRRPLNRLNDIFLTYRNLVSVAGVATTCGTVTSSTIDGTDAHRFIAARRRSRIWRSAIP